MIFMPVESLYKTYGIDFIINYALWARHKFFNIPILLQVLQECDDALGQVTGELTD